MREAVPGPRAIFQTDFSHTYLSRVQYSTAKFAEALLATLGPTHICAIRVVTINKAHAGLMVPRILLQAS
jgi:hypothetical protein